MADVRVGDFNVGDKVLWQSKYSGAIKGVVVAVTGTGMLTIRVTSWLNRTYNHGHLAGVWHRSLVKR